MDHIPPENYDVQETFLYEINLVQLSILSIYKQK